MKDVIVRNYESYTLVLINNMSTLSFLKASELSDELKQVRPTIVKPSKKCWEEFKKYQDSIIENKRVGQKFEIMGVNFKILENTELLGDLKVEYTYYNKYFNKNVTESLSFLLQQSLIEIVYLSLTNGSLLFF